MHFYALAFVCRGCLLPPTWICQSDVGSLSWTKQMYAIVVPHNFIVDSLVIKLTVPGCVMFD